MGYASDVARSDKQHYHRVQETQQMIYGETARAWGLVLMRKHEDIGDQVVCVEPCWIPRPAGKLELR